VIGDADAAAGTRDALASAFDAARQRGEAPCRAVVSALARISGWRWAGVSRLAESGTRVEVLAWWDSGEPGRCFTYPLEGSPCQQVFEGPGYCLIPDVAARFPADVDLARMGARLYAGLVLRDAAGGVCGHVFLLHDALRPDAALAEPLLGLAAQLIARAPAQD